MRLRLLVLCLLLTAGCHRAPPPQVAVRGKVLVNGEPLRGGTVVFTPDEKRGARGPVSFAILDGDGAFDLASENGPGAIAGWHRVTVAPPASSADLIAGLARYRHPDLSGLEYEVKPGQENIATFQLEWQQ
jgi:hypothetical protein